MLCLIFTLLPAMRRFFSEIRAPWAFMARVTASSSKGLPCASLPRMRTLTCINTRWLRRRAPGFVAGLVTWLMTVSPIQLYAVRRACREVRPKGIRKGYGPVRQATKASLFTICLRLRGLKSAALRGGLGREGLRILALFDGEVMAGVVAKINLARARDFLFGVEKHFFPLGNPAGSARDGK